MKIIIFFIIIIIILITMFFCKYTKESFYSKIFKYVNKEEEIHNEALKLQASQNYNNILNNREVTNTIITHLQDNYNEYANLDNKEKFFEELNKNFLNNDNISFFLLFEYLDSKDSVDQATKDNYFTYIYSKLWKTIGYDNILNIINKEKDIIYELFKKKDFNNLKLKFNHILDNNIELTKIQDKYDNLPCIMHDILNCPTGKDKRCKYDFDNNICYPNKDNLDIKHLVGDCEALSVYGKGYCESQKDNCFYEDKTKKCINKFDCSKQERVVLDKQKITSCGNFCEETEDGKCKNKPGNLGDIKPVCSDIIPNKEDDCNVERSWGDWWSGVNKCEFKNAKTKTNSHNFKVCFSENDKDELKHLEELNYEELNKKDCGMFDNSKYYIKDGKFEKKKKKLLAKDERFLKYLCENIKKEDEPDKNKCKLVYTELYNNRKIHNCVPIETKLSNNYINSQQDCVLNDKDNLYYWSGKNERCVNLRDKCNDIKNKTLCKYNKKCIWQSAGVSDKNGFCKNFYSKDLENVIDILHKNEINKIAKQQILDNKFTKYLGEYLKNKNKIK